MTKLFSMIASVLAVALAAFFAFLLLIWMPVALYGESQCFRAGFPKANTTIGLDTYCMTVDGAVTPRVVKLP